jgi:hypothetical protein
MFKNVVARLRGGDSRKKWGTNVKPPVFCTKCWEWRPSFFISSFIVMYGCDDTPEVSFLLSFRVKCTLTLSLFLPLFLCNCMSSSLRTCPMSADMHTFFPFPTSIDPVILAIGSISQVLTYLGTTQTDPAGVVLLQVQNVCTTASAMHMRGALHIYSTVIQYQLHMKQKRKQSINANNKPHHHLPHLPQTQHPMHTHLLSLSLSPTERSRSY